MHATIYSKVKNLILDKLGCSVTPLGEGFCHERGETASYRRGVRSERGVTLQAVKLDFFLHVFDRVP
jgi:hypothetical protein